MAPHRQRTRALLLTLGASALLCCSRQGQQAAPPIARPHAAFAAPTEPLFVEGSSFRFPLPDGYEDISAELHERGAPPTTVAARAKASTKGYQPTITVQRAGVHVHTTDLKTCAENGDMIASGVNGKLGGASMVEGPAGEACQFHLVAPQGAAIITELFEPDATWLVTCNHADGDTQAQSICRATIAAFEFKK